MLFVFFKQHEKKKKKVRNQMSFPCFPHFLEQKTVLKNENHTDPNIFKKKHLLVIFQLIFEDCLKNNHINM